ncbi:MAG: hypothetical protein IID48_09485 [Proteobacteria bacterium]|nr:hypothetical protein [Pseudomonadota bacterium]
MQNIGEEITGDYLKIVKGCDFIEYNLYTPDVQGEIDVVGIDIKNKRLYVCEVAIHLVTGLQYVKNDQPDNVDRFVKKFTKNIDYAEKYFGDHEKHFMLWSPIVKNSSPTSKNNQLNDVTQVKQILEKKFGYSLELIINEEYRKCLDQIRDFARSETKELKSPVLRLMQIEEKLNAHLEKLRA